MAITTRARRAWAHRHDPAIRPRIGQVIGRRLLLGGRVLRAGALTPATASTARWRNLFNTYRTFVHTTIAGARLLATFGNARIELVTDHDGYFSVEMMLPEPVRGPFRQQVEFALLEVPGWPGPTIRAVGRVLVHPPSPRFAVISDIDDTVLSANVTRKFRMLLTVLLSNAHTRLPFDGVAALYRAFERGRGDEHNPIFYVSNSPWNLHDLLVEFFELNRIPLGPILLRDWGLHMVMAPQPAGTHKRVQIEKILTYFPGIPVILIGDSGEHDAAIFTRIARKFPGRVDTIYIRCVDNGIRRRQALQRLGDGIESLGTDFVLVQDSAAVAEHAARRGLISAFPIPNSA